MNSIPRTCIASFTLLLVSFQGPDERHRAPEPSPWTELDELALGIAADRREARSVALEGRVLLPGGAPAAGAVVVTSAGGKAVTDGSGEYRLEVRLASAARELHLTAVHAHRGLSLLANARVAVDSAGGSIRTGTLELGAGGSCEPSWLPTFGGQPGTNGHVSVLTVHDDGSGRGLALYAGGNFTSAGGVSANYVARWDGSSWSALGEGMNEPVGALAVYDDGAGPALYAGGGFTSAGGVSASYIAKWDGTSWSALDIGMNEWVYALTVYDDGLGGGPALYAGGTFTSAGGVSANRIAKWDGASWSALGSGLNSRVSALSVYDDGSGGGPALYAGGAFTNAGGVSANYIAKWDGTSWSSLGSGMAGSPVGVFVLTVYDDGAGGGPALYVGGEFTSAGGVAASRIARWNGTSWSGLGSGMSDRVFALAVYDDGTGRGARLYAGGWFWNAGGVEVRRIAKWDGVSWKPLGTGANLGVFALAVYDEGAGGGPVLYAGGHLTTVGGLSVNHVAKWDGAAWSTVGNGVNSWVYALAVYDDGAGGGPALYAGGPFSSAGGANAARIAKWDGTSWSALGSGIGVSVSWVEALAVYDDGAGGDALYAGGNFLDAGGEGANYVAKWDGASWSPLGSGVNSHVSVLAVYDDGAGGGPALYVGGSFTSAGGTSASRIAKWDGTSWSALGFGMGGTQPTVHALTGYDDGGGPALYAGGNFTTAGGASASRIAKWNGTSWSPLGIGLDARVLALTTFDDGTGPALYAGGNFSTAGGVSASRIAKWDGTSWSPLGSGTSSGVLALTVYQGGAGGAPALYAGGGFTVAGGMAVNRIAKWDGSSWSALGSGMNDTVRALAVYQDAADGGLALCAGGSFTASPGGDSYVARWDGCSDAGLGTPYCFGDGGGTPCPCGNAGGAGEGCANSTGAGAVLSASGSVSIGASDLVLTGAGLVRSQSGLYFQGDVRVNGGDGVSFGDGLRCAGGGVVRLQVRIADGSGTSSTTVNVAAAGSVSPGDTMTYQLWYRDPIPSPCSSGFNLTNGLELTWTP